MKQTQESTPKNITPIQPNQDKKPKLDLKYQRDQDAQMVKGIFRFHEVPGGTMGFTVRFYKEDQPETYTMVDGGVYTVPLGVARHLNKNLWYPVHAYYSDENNRSLMKIGNKVRRCSFQSLEFIDTEDFTPVGNTLVTAEILGG